MKTMQRLVQLFVCAFTLLLVFPAHANLLEQILNNPRVQAHLGNTAKATNLLNACKNSTYSQRNAQACTEVRQAEMVYKLPFEMRTVMSNSKSAQSLRDLCIAAQNTPQRDSYLCTELAKADSSFNATLQGTRANLPQSGGSPGNEASN
jgi:hypothetical protein